MPQVDKVLLATLVPLEQHDLKEKAGTTGPSGAAGPTGRTRATGGRGVTGYTGATRATGPKGEGRSNRTMWNWMNRYTRSYILNKCVILQNSGV